MTDFTTTADRVANADTDEAWCPDCGNSGWVELAGTTTQHGITYSRGMAPCKWCELGRRRYEAATRKSTKGDPHRPWRPLEDFTRDDVLPVGERDPRPAKAKEPLVRELPGLDDAPVKDLEQGARSTFAAWCSALGRDLAAQRLRDQRPELDRQVYPPELADTVIAEWDALHPDGDPAPPLEAVQTPPPAPDTPDTPEEEL